METYSLPAFFIYPLCYDDFTGLDKNEAFLLECFLSDHPEISHCSSVSEETHFGEYKGIGHTMAEFTFILKH